MSTIYQSKNENATTNPLVNAIAEDETHTLTENGAKARNTSGDRLVDLFGTIGALRDADADRITRLLADAYAEDPLIATKMVFYARDIRGGLGERDTFRTMLSWMATYHPEAVRPNIRLIPVYGRWDDMYCLLDTPLEGDMWVTMGQQLADDLLNLKVEGASVSLLAKWVKTPGVSSKRSSALGHRTAKALGYSDYDFKRVIRSLRRRLDIVEAKMSAKQWDKIDYEAVPSKAMTNYRNAFERHDGERYRSFVHDAMTPVDGALDEFKATIHSGTLYPYDIVNKVMNDDGRSQAASDTLEAQWRQLPNYVDDDSNVLVVADVSGSMMGGWYTRGSSVPPIASSIGLAIYFAQRNHGPFAGYWMDFSSESDFHKVEGETLAQTVHAMEHGHWGMSTNLRGAFEHVLNLAIKSHATQADMPKALVVISDMEIDEAQCDWRFTDSNDGSWSFHKDMEREYARHGYELPTVVYWNVDSRHDTFHADANRKGVMLVSGHSAGTFRNVISAIGMTAYEAMLNALNVPRYDAVLVEGVNWIRAD